MKEALSIFNVVYPIKDLFFLKIAHRNRNWRDEPFGTVAAPVAVIADHLWHTFIEMFESHQRYVDMEYKPNTLHVYVAGTLCIPGDVGDVEIMNQLEYECFIRRRP